MSNSPYFFNNIFSSDTSNNGNAIIKSIDDFFRTSDIYILNSMSAADLVNEMNIEQKQKIFENLQLVTSSIGCSWREKSRWIKIGENIKLYSDDVKVRAGYDYNFGKISDITKSGIFKILQNASTGIFQAVAAYDEITNKGEINENTFKYQDRVNVYKEVPYFEDISTSMIDSISFSFNWGQYGLYNCELEVVKPIIALMSCFGSNIDGKGFIEPPFANKYQVVTNAYKAIFEKVDESAIGKEKKLNNLMKATLTGNQNIANVADSSDASVISSLTKSLSNLYSDIAGSTPVTAALFRVGFGIFGPVFVSDVNYEFDFSQQDEYGMPYKGKITLGGIKPVFVDSIDSFALTGSYLTEGLGSIPNSKNNNNGSTGA